MPLCTLEQHIGLTDAQEDGAQDEGAHESEAAGTQSEEAAPAASEKPSDVAFNLFGTDQVQLFQPGMEQGEIAADSAANEDDDDESEDEDRHWKR